MPDTDDEIGTPWGNVKSFIMFVEAAAENAEAEKFVRGLIARSAGSADGMPVSLLQELGRVIYKNRLAELREQQRVQENN